MPRRLLRIRAGFLVGLPLAALAGVSVANDLPVSDSGVRERGALAEVYGGPVPEGACSLMTTDFMVEPSPDELDSSSAPPGAPTVDMPAHRNRQLPSSAANSSAKA